MATTYTGFNETILMKDAIFSLKNALMPIRAFSTAVSAEGKLYGDVMKVSLHGVATAATRTLGADGTDSGSSTTASVTLGHPTSSQWSAVNGKDPITAFMDRGIEAAFAVAQGVLDAALAYVTAANYGNVEDTDKLTIPQAEFGLSDVATFNSIADAKKISQRERRMILNSQYAWQLLGESALVMVTAGQNGIISGQLPNIGVKEAYAYAGLPANGESLKGLICDPSCLAIGMAPPASLGVASGTGNLITSQVIVDPETGIAMLYERYYDAATGKMTGRFEVMTGFAKCNNAVVRLVG